MRQTPFLDMGVPQNVDDVLVDVLGSAFDVVDTAIQLNAGSGISVTQDSTTKRQTVNVSPFTNINAESNTEFPSSAAVASFVQAQVSGSGTYQGQFGYFGTKIQIQSQTPPDSTFYTGVYLESNKVYTMTYSAGAWGAGVLAPSQTSGDSYDIRALLDFPATGGGFESGQIRLVVQSGVAEFVVTGASKAVRGVSASVPATVDNTDPFNPIIGVTLGAVSSGNTTTPVSGAAVQSGLNTKQNSLSGTAGNVVVFGNTAGAVQSRPISSVPTDGSNAVITSGAVYAAGLTLEGSEWAISFSETEPVPVPGEKILWLHA